MAISLDARIQSIISDAAAKIAAAVRASIAEEINRAVAPGSASPPSVAKRRGRPLGVAKAPSAKLAAPPAKRATPAKGGRRTSEAVAADNSKLLAFVRANPGKRSEEIQKGVGLPKQNVASGLVALREAGRVKMTGIKRAATYAAG